MLAALAACSDDVKTSNSDPVDAGSDAAVDAGPPKVGTFTDTGALTPDSHFFRDEQGRALILRGLNARIEGVFDVTFDDGRTPVEEIPSFGEEDCERMGQLGFSLLRLPINWSAIEPTKDEFDEAYMKRVDAVIACLKKQGIYTLVDIHQDAYSKEIGEDGAPLWAIVPAPEMLLEGPLGEGELMARRLSGQVTKAFQSFFDDADANGLQAQYIEMLEYVAKRYEKEPAVIGLDLFNEPFIGAAKAVAFNAKAAAAVRKVAPELTIMFEPSGLWSRLGGEPVTTGPFATDKAVFAPHLYAVSIEGDEEERKNVKRASLLPSFETAAEEAKDWGTPWLIGEFGAGPSVTNYEAYLKVQYDLQDEFLVSSALWLWKENTQGAWGLFDRVDDAWVERPAMVTAVSRPHVMRTAGTPTKMTFADDTLSLDYEDAIDAPNLVFVPERFVIESVTCDGKAVQPSADTGKVQITCEGEGEHALRLTLAAAP